MSSQQSSTNQTELPLSMQEPRSEVVSMIAQALEGLSGETDGDEARSSIEQLIKALQENPPGLADNLSAALRRYPKGAQRFLEYLEEDPLATRETFAQLAASEVVELLRQFDLQDPFAEDRLFCLFQAENPRQAQQVYMSIANANRGGYLTKHLHSGRYHSGDGITLEESEPPPLTYKFLR